MGATSIVNLQENGVVQRYIGTEVEYRRSAVSTVATTDPVRKSLARPLKLLGETLALVSARAYPLVPLETDIASD